MELGSLSDRIRQLAADVAERRGFEFVHGQIVGTKRNPIVRIYIDKPSGVTLDDCADVSREIETGLDLEDLIPSSYVLEVSSPGIERGLYSLDDFRKFTGQSARVRMAEPIDGQRNFSGEIIGVEGGNVVLEDKTRGRVSVRYDKVAKANLMVDLAGEFRRA